jgi:hypothetical protein
VKLSNNDRREKDADARRFGRRIDDRRRGDIHPFPVDRLPIIAAAVLVIITVAVMPVPSLLITVTVMPASSAVMTIIAE